VPPFTVELGQKNMKNKAPHRYREELLPDERLGPLVVDGELYFSPLDLARYELAQYKVANTVHSLNLHRAQIDRIQRKAEEDVRNINMQIVQLQSTLKSQEQELVAMQKDLAALYGIEMSAITYDDKTGRLLVEDDPIHVPPNPTQKIRRKK
jgi:hypothetical protein